MQKLYEVAQKHFLAKENLVFLMQDEKSLTFLDDFLWKFPQDSFLPHICHSTKDETALSIILSKEYQPLSMHCVFNLTTKPVSATKYIKKVYEFEEINVPDKKAQAQEKYQFYRNQGYILGLEN
ncbi:MAG: DNA polymerase III subunit chi [Rhabdochlamydiaceae bacterium]